ncbi:MAG: sigma-70 family RNA polymerase sigma factor [Planctomycetaceae bacterium]|nr:sigma-70 family RNA polymerase sigma factor [Planctomycetaceae bacterium]
MNDDDQLMIRLQEGDTTAFDELVERYQGQLIGFFVRNTRDRYLAEDLTQETLLKVFDQSWNYLPTGRFRGWMYRIARNLMIDDHRRRSHDALIRAVKGRKSDEDDGLARLAGEILSPTECASANELSELVDDALADLPDEQRLTFTLFHYAGVPLADVAEVMKTKLPTCKSRLRLAREKLGEYLKSKGIQPVTTDHPSD